MTTKKKFENYLDKLRIERMNQPHMTEAEFYQQMSRMMGKPIAKIMKPKSDIQELADKIDRERFESKLLIRKLALERDEAYNALKVIRKAYGGQLADEECGCGDCEVLLKIDAIIKKQEL